jgi:hypothetical protein
MHVSTPAGARLTIQLAGRAGAIRIRFALGLTVAKAIKQRNSKRYIKFIQAKKNRPRRLFNSN